MSSSHRSSSEVNEPLCSGLACQSSFFRQIEDKGIAKGSKETLPPYQARSRKVWYDELKAGAYLYLRIIEIMIEGHPFLYRAIGGTVYHVSKKGVEAIQSWSSEEAIVAFIDGDKGDYEAKDFLIRREVQFIVVASPKGAFKKWTK